MHAPLKTCIAVPKFVASKQVVASKMFPFPTTENQTLGAKLGSPGLPPLPQKKFSSVVAFRVVPSITKDPSIGNGVASGQAILGGGNMISVGIRVGLSVGLGDGSCGVGLGVVSVCVGIAVVGACVGMGVPGGPS